MTKNNQFESVFKELHAILMPYADEMTLDLNESNKIYINTKFIMPNKKVMFFGAATIGKNFVSYHLMPVYCYPELLKDISPELKKRMQGKSCFNFKVINTELFSELAQLTQSGYKKYKVVGYV